MLVAEVTRSHGLPARLYGTRTVICGEWIYPTEEAFGFKSIMFSNFGSLHIISFDVAGPDSRSVDRFETTWFRCKAEVLAISISCKIFADVFLGVD